MASSGGNSQNGRSLPDGWEWTTVGRVVTFEYGKGLTEKYRDQTGKVPVYGSNGIVGHHSSALVQKPCLIIGRKGAAGAVHKSDVPCWPIDTTYYAIPSDAVNLSFLYHLFRSLDFSSLDRSTAIPGLNRNDAYAIEMPLPPLPEQSRIVSRIEELFSDLDAGVAALERVRAGLKRYKASVLKAAVEGRLLENRGAESSDGLPQGWQWSKVEDLNPPGRRCAYGVLQPGSDLDDGILFVRVGDINDGRIDVGNLKRIDPRIAARYPRTRLQGGEVLISLVGAIGRTAIVPESLAGANTARAVGVVPIRDGVHAPWVEIWFRNPEKIAEMTSKAHEVARKTLNLEDVRSARVALPPLHEQHQIVAEVERRLSVVRQIEQAVEAGLARAARLRQAVLKTAFEGRL